MSVYKRKGSPFWWYRFQIQGREFRGSTGHTSKREAIACERAERDRQKLEPAGPLTLDAACARYWTDHGHRLKAARHHAGKIKIFLQLIGGDTLLSDLSNDHIAKYVAVRRTQIQSSTLIVEIAILRAIHTMARDLWEVPVRGVMWRKHSPKKPKGRVRHITREEAANLLEACPPHIAMIVEFALLTGCRKSEILGLTWDCVNLHERWAEIVDGKTGTRRIHLADRTFILLANLPRNSGDRVFNATNLRKHFWKACELCELKNFTFHDLRHTHATMLRNSGVPLELVQQSLGHKSIGMTLRYAHIGQGEVMDAVQKIGTISATMEKNIK